MNRNIKTSIIAKIAIFLLTACLSFFITKIIVDRYRVDSNTIIPEQPNSGLVSPAPEPVSPAPKPVSPAPKPVSSTPEPEPIILRASKPTLNDDNTYSFKASFSGNVTEAYHYELWNNGDMIKKSENGSFDNIAEGDYKLCLVSEISGNNLAQPVKVKAFTKTIEQKKLISEEDFQTRMLDKNDRSLHGGKKSVVTKQFKVIVVNEVATEGEFAVSDIQDVRDMIYTYNKWKSARVVELEYDAKGYVTQAKIEPVY